MKIELDWQAENEEGAWEPVATIERQPRFHLPPWIWGSALTFLLLFGAVGYLTVRYRYHRALAWTTFQIQGAIDSEAQALAKGDRRLFLAQQDRAARAWYARQAGSPHLATCIMQARKTQVAGRPATAPQSCLSPIQGEVQDVELRGDVAWVEVITGPGRADGGGRLRQARFYRQTEQGWLHTAPRPEFWNDPVTRTYGSIMARYDERDAPYVEPLIEQVERITADVSRSLGGFQMEGLEVTFTPEPPSGELPTPEDEGLILPSPWTSGIPLDGEWDGAYLNQLRYRVAYAVTAQFVGHHAGKEAGDEARLSQLQRALVGEYAAWYAEGDLAGAPILERIARRHGPEALPLALQSTKRSSSKFVTDWLALSPSERDAYAQGIAQIEFDALDAGRWETLEWVTMFLAGPSWAGLACNQGSEFCS